MGARDAHKRRRGRASATAISDPPSTGSGRRGASLVGGIALLAVNLRLAVVAVAPLTSRVRAGTGLSSVGVSLLTTLPVLCFGAVAIVAPHLGRRIGLERALLVAIATLLTGIMVRLVPGTGPLFAGSAIAGAGIAIENVLLPGLIKREFPGRTGPMMAMYSLMLSGGAAAAAGLTVPLAKALGTGWRPALGLWGIPAALALVVWLPTAVRSRGTTGLPLAGRGGGAAGAPAAGAPAAGAPAAGLASAERRSPADRPTAARPRSVWRLRLAWWTAAYMAAQSLVYYSLGAWLPTLLEDHGVAAGTAGAMLATFNLTGIATGLTMPVIAARRHSQRGLVSSVGVVDVVGLVGLLAAPAAGAWAWMVLLGLAQGASISLGLTLFVLRTRSPAASAELAGMAQTVGYLIAALGPLTVGALHGATGGWSAGLSELLAVSVVMAAAGWVAGTPRTLETGG